VGSYGKEKGKKDVGTPQRGGGGKERVSDNAGDAGGGAEKIKRKRRELRSSDRFE